MRDTTAKELIEEVKDLKMSIETLKTEMGANTTATGFNTLAVEGITAGLKELASQTGDWRSDDKEHHEEEGKLDKEKVEIMRELKGLFEADPKNGIKRIC